MKYQFTLSNINEMSKNLFLMIIVAISILPLVACNGEDPVNNTVIVRITVYGMYGGLPIQNATVTVGGFSINTNSAGYAELTLNPPQSNSYAVIVSDTTQILTREVTKSLEDLRNGVAITVVELKYYSDAATRTLSHDEVATWINETARFETGQIMNLDINEIWVYDNGLLPYGPITCGNMLAGTIQRATGKVLTVKTTTNVYASSNDVPDHVAYVTGSNWDNGTDMRKSGNNITATYTTLNPLAVAQFGDKVIRHEGLRICGWGTSTSVPANILPSLAWDGQNNTPELTPEDMSQADLLLAIFIQQRGTGNTFPDKN